MDLSNCTDKIVGLVATTGWAAAALTPASAIAAVEPVTGGIILASALAMQMHKNGKNECKVALEKTLKKIERDINKYADRIGYDEDTRIEITAAFHAFAEVLPDIRPSYDDLIAKWRLDPATIASELMQRAIDAHNDIANSPEGQRHLRTVFAIATAELKDNADLNDKIDPAFKRQVLADLKLLPQIAADARRAADNTDDLRAQLARQTALIERLVERLDEEQKQRSENAGIPRATIIALAKRINKAVEDETQALAELSAVVDIAIRVAQQGARGSNYGSFVDDVLKEIAALSRAGQFDAAAGKADIAFERWQREEADRREAARAEGLSLLQSGLDQDLLRRNPASAARRVTEMVDLQTPDPSLRLGALRSVQEEWYERGRDKGLNLDLEISIEIARIAVDRAVNADQRGSALNHLAITLATLGGRESGTARLKQAVTAFRSALKELTRDRVPFHWAATQNNLGAALFTLGERESGTARLEEAVAAYLAALDEWTRDRVPQQWATAKNNLGNALQTLGRRETGTARLEGAAAAFRAALEEQARERVPLDWARTQNNLGVALRILGERESGTGRLEEAVASYRAALEERTRDRVPLDWAMTQNNLGNALSILGIRESGTARLEQAVAAYRAAIEERTRDRVPFLWAQTMENLALAFDILFDKSAHCPTLDEAIAHVEAALAVYTPADTPYYFEQAARLRDELVDKKQRSCP